MARWLFALPLRSVSPFRFTFSCIFPAVRRIVLVIAVVGILIGKSTAANAAITLTFQGTGSDADVSFQFVSPVPLNTPGLQTTFSFIYCHPPSGESCDQVNYSAGSGVLRFTAVGSSVDTRTFEFLSFINNGTYSTVAGSPNSGNLTVTGSTNALVLSPTSLPFGTYNEAYSQTISASGGTTPYTYTVTPANSLPPGLMLSSSGVLSGTPTAAGSFSFTVSATDTLGDNGSRAYTLIIGNTFVVTTTLDDATGTASNCPGSSCSLRDALAAAAADSGDEITFDPTLFSTPHTITATSTLNLPSNTTIAGATSGHGALLTNLVTISGGGPNSYFPVFTVNAGVTGAAISNLIIANGLVDSNGGGILNQGSLVVTNSTLANNSAGGAIGGGAIHNTNNANLTIVGSTFTGNYSPGGGAVAIESGQVTITNSTFYRNLVLGNGGAIFVNGGTVSVNGSTVSGNIAEGGGGIANYGTLTVENSILSGNTGGDCGGTSTCPTNGSNGNVVGISNINLAPLGSYGGPTQTMLPLPGSVAICAGSPPMIPVDVTTDQRGFQRTNTSYTGYSSSNPCVDAGAVQTNYESVQFSSSSYSGSSNKAISPAPVVSVTENAQNLGGVPITLSFSGTGTASGLGPVSTVAGVGASFAALSVNRGGSDMLSVALPITAGDTLSDSAALDIAAAAAPTTTTASSASATASASNQAVTLSATVTSSVGTVNEGTVAFTVFEGGVVIGATASRTVTNGVATVSYTVPGGTAAGTYTIDAAYTDSSGNFAASGDSAHTLTVNPGSYVLTVTANNATRAYGAPNPAFTGTVTGAVNGDSFTESFTTTATQGSSVGTYSIVPSVTGANLSNYTVVIHNGTLTITQAASITTLTASNASITPGQNLTLTAQVKSATTGTPTGSVNFYDGSSLLNTATLANGTATYTTASLGSGSHALTAIYSGDTNFTASNSGTASTVTVGSLDFTISVSGASSQTVIPGRAVNYGINVTPLYGMYPGPVNFSLSGLPAGATGTFSPASIAANGGAETVSLTIQTASASASNAVSPLDRRLAPIALGLLLLPLIGARRLRRSGKTLGRMLYLGLLIIGGAIGTGVLSGCGSSNGFLGQAPTNYTVTVTATSGTVQHTASVNLNLQ